MTRRPLYTLFVADSISLVGNVVAQVAIPWFVLVTTGSPTLTGVAVLMTFLPVVIAGLFGGVVVDRLGFRTTSVLADLGSGVAIAAIPLLHATRGLRFWELLVLVFLGALVDAPGATARQVLFPELAEAAGVRLERAWGFRGAVQRSAWLVGAPIGGVLVSHVGATTALWLDAGSFVVSAVLVATAVPRVRREVAAESPGRFLAELGEGLRFIWSMRLFRALVLTILLTNLLAAPEPVAMPVFARKAFGSATELGLLYGASGGAALVGALAFSALGHRLPRRLTLVSAFGVAPFVYLTLATLPPLPVALAAVAVGGLSGGPVNPLLNTVQFELVPQHLRGRVFGAVRAGAWASVPLGVLLGGVVISAIGVAATFLTIGIAYACVSAYGFFNPAFRELDAR